MGLGRIDNQELVKKTYISLSRGKVLKATREAKEYFNYVEGRLDDIYSKQRNFNGSPSTFWYIDIRDGGELFSLSIPYDSGTFMSIILQLASVEELSKDTMIRIEPYLGENGFTKIKVFADGEKLDWITKELPPIENVMIGAKPVKDNTKRMAYIEYLASMVKERLNFHK